MAHYDGFVESEKINFQRGEIERLQRTNAELLKDIEAESQDGDKDAAEIKALEAKLAAAEAALRRKDLVISENWGEGVTRDPRKNPKVGDVIARDFKTAKGGCIIREATRAHGGFVFFAADNGYYVKHKIVPLWEWQRWAEKAYVIEAAKKGDKSE